MGNPRKVHPMQWNSTGAKDRSKADPEWPEEISVLRKERAAKQQQTWQSALLF